MFICSIKCNASGLYTPAGGAFYATDKQKKRSEKANKHA
jgi:hypothetical protein